MFLRHANFLPNELVPFLFIRLCNILNILLLDNALFYMLMVINLQPLYRTYQRRKTSFFYCRLVIFHSKEMKLHEKGWALKLNLHVSNFSNPFSGFLLDATSILIWSSNNHSDMKWHQLLHFYSNKFEHFTFTLHHLPKNNIYQMHIFF